MDNKITYTLTNGVEVLDLGQTDYDLKREIMASRGNAGVNLHPGEDTDFVRDLFAATHPSLALHFGTPTGNDDVQRKRVTAVVTKDGTSLQSVFATPLQAAVLSAGEWELTTSFEMKLDTAAVWGASGPDVAAKAVLQLNGVEVKQWVWAHDQYTVLSDTDSKLFAEGDTPEFDLLIDKIGGSGDVSVRRVSLTLKRIDRPVVDNDE